MELQLHRVKFYPTHTIGQLYIDQELFCFVLEDVVREPDTRPASGLEEWVKTWKVQDQTAIPTGKYKITLENSPKFGPDTMTLNSVPGYQYIRIHPGNTDKDTDGCLIVGYQLTVLGNDTNVIKPGTTRPAVADLKQRVKDGLKDGEVWITIDTVK